MEKFMKQFSTLPDEFIHDFFDIVKEDNIGNEKIINLELASKWLHIRKDNLKRILQTKIFKKDYDYEIIKKKIKYENGTKYKEEIMITSNCFKHLSMMGKTEQANMVRMYFIELEQIVKKYNNYIKEKLYKKIGLLEYNQKPKINNKKGVLYVINAQNSDETLYKLGKSHDIKKRLNTYNSENANNIEPLFIIEVDDVDKVERCIKALVKEYQYRKYKEIYKIDYNFLKKIIEKCVDVTNQLAKDYEKNEKTYSKKMSRIKKIDNLFLYIDK